MADLDVVAALIRKRAELADLIEHQQKEQKEIKRLTEVLAHIEATVTLFSPDFELRTGARARPFETAFSVQANASGWSWTSFVRRKARR